MAEILIIVGWIVAIGCFLYLAVETLKNRFSGRRSGTARRKMRLLKRHPFRGNQAQTIDGAPAPSPYQARRNFRRRIRRFEFVLLILWEAYWISEVADRFSHAANPWQLPYVFLFVVMVGVPLAVFLITRWLLRRSIASPQPHHRPIM